MRPSPRNSCDEPALAKRAVHDVLEGVLGIRSDIRHLPTFTALLDCERVGLPRLPVRVCQTRGHVDVANLPGFGIHTPYLAQSADRCLLRGGDVYGAHVVARARQYLESRFDPRRIEEVRNHDGETPRSRRRGEL